MAKSVNYIKHHVNVSSKLSEVAELSSTHIALYHALFVLWNYAGFPKTLSINRRDIMDLSKIGSANTYTKCLHELDKHGFIKYNPSRNPLLGSTINMYNFDNSAGQVVYMSCTSSDNSSDTTCDTLYKVLKKETIKLLKGNAPLVNEKLESWILAEEEFAHILSEEPKNESTQKGGGGDFYTKSTPAENAIRMAWVSFRKKKNMADATFGTNEDKAIKEIAKRILSICERNNVNPDQQTIIDTMTGVLTIGYSDKWLKERFLLSNINAQFDALFNKIKRKHDEFAPDYFNFDNK